jgi:hypothetical protein
LGVFGDAEGVGVFGFLIFLLIVGGGLDFWVRFWGPADGKKFSIVLPQSLFWLWQLVTHGRKPL